MIFIMGFGKLQLYANFEVASFSRCRNILGNPKIWGAPLAQGHGHFSHGCDFYDGPWQTPAVSLASAIP